MLKLISRKRIADEWGQGSYQAPRGDRTHTGVDYVAPAGFRLLSPVEGYITKHGYPYSDDLSFRYIEVTDKNDKRHRFFYVMPSQDCGTKVHVGQILGTVQSLDQRYPKITPHVHYEIKDEDGEFINPEEYKV